MVRVADWKPGGLTEKRRALRRSTREAEIAVAAASSHHRQRQGREGRAGGQRHPLDRDRPHARAVVVTGRDTKRVLPAGMGRLIRHGYVATSIGGQAGGRPGIRGNRQRVAAGAEAGAVLHRPVRTAATRSPSTPTWPSNSATPSAAQTAQSAAELLRPKAKPAATRRFPALLKKPERLRALQAARAA